MTQQPALSVRKFAEANDVSEATIWRLIARGEIDSFRIGSQRRIRADVLERIQSGAAG